MSEEIKFSKINNPNSWDDDSLVILAECTEDGYSVDESTIIKFRDFIESRLFKQISMLTGVISQAERMTLMGDCEPAHDLLNDTLFSSTSPSARAAEWMKRHDDFIRKDCIDMCVHRLESMADKSIDEIVLAMRSIVK